MSDLVGNPEDCFSGIMAHLRGLIEKTAPAVGDKH